MTDVASGVASSVRDTIKKSGVAEAAGKSIKSTTDRISHASTRAQESVNKVHEQVSKTTLWKKAAKLSEAAAVTKGTIEGSVDSTALVVRERVSGMAIAISFY